MRYELFLCFVISSFSLGFNGKMDDECCCKNCMPYVLKLGYIRPVIQNMLTPYGGFGPSWFLSVCLTDEPFNC